MPWDVTDWLFSDAKATLHPSAQAGYFNLLCHDWINNGIEADTKRLRQYSGLSSKLWDRHAKNILKYFAIGEDGKYHNPRVLKEKALAITRLEKNKERTEAARKAREKLCNSSVTEKQQKSVTDTVTATQDRTVHKKEIPTSSQHPRREERISPKPSLVDPEPNSLYPPTGLSRPIDNHKLDQALNNIINGLDRNQDPRKD